MESEAGQYDTKHVYNLWFVLTIVLTICFISGEYLSARQQMVARIVKLLS